jgi:pimeloyl-ACP methyl ester carboxylesterase
MQIPWYIGWTLAAAIGFGILSLAAARAPFYPLKYPSGFWDLQSELKAEDIWLGTADGVRLHAWWVAPTQAPLVTLYLHGNAGNVTHRFLQIHEITAAGSSVLMLDYRGYGKSEALQASTACMQMPTQRTNICWIVVTVRGKSSYRENRWARLLRWIWLPERIVRV